MSVVNATILIAGYPILVREIVGNLFGLASALGGVKRAVWAWPVGIIGNLILFTVFLGGIFHTPQEVDLYGQAGRQIMFLAVSIYGWYTWSRNKKEGSQANDSTAAVQPHWATARQRIDMVLFAIAGTIIFSIIFKLLGSWGPVADAWIFTGSMLATYGMARGWTEFWLIWIAVDIVGIPLLLSAGYYPSAALYFVYALFVLWGFFVWKRQNAPPDSDPDRATQAHV